MINLPIVDLVQDATRRLPPAYRSRRRARATPNPDAAPLDVIASRIVGCERCPRLRAYCTAIARAPKTVFRDQVYWARPVPGFGDPAARLLVVGLAPAAHGANRTGRFFTGDVPGGSGDFLISALHRAGFANQPMSISRDDGLVLTDTFISAAVRCAPPDNRPAPAELAACLPYLVEELAALPSTRVVVTLGKIAWDAWFQLLARAGAPVRPRPVFGHCAIWRGERAAVVGAFHPSRQNTNTGKLTAAMYDELFRAVRQELGAEAKP